MSDYESKYSFYIPVVKKMQFIYFLLNFFHYSVLAMSVWKPLFEYLRHFSVLDIVL